MPSLPRPIVTRSNISVVSAVPQPLPTPPTTALGVERDVVEEDLVELGLAGDLAQAADGHALGVHRHDEHRQALVLGHVGVGAREQQAVGGELRVGRPHLLARQAPAAVVLLARARLHRRQVGAGGGLGEQLAPDLVAVQHRAEVARLLLVGAVGDDRRAEHADADRVEDPGHFRAARSPGCRSPARSGRGPGRRTPSARSRRRGRPRRACPARRGGRRRSPSSSCSAPGPLRTGASALCSSSHARTCARYAACSGVSSRSTAFLLWLTGQSIWSETVLLERSIVAARRRSLRRLRASAARDGRLVVDVLEAAVEQLARLRAGVGRVQQHHAEAHAVALGGRDQAAAGGVGVAGLQPRQRRGSGRSAAGCCCTGRACRP